jgi:hypothetical protein
MEQQLWKRVARQGGCKSKAQSFLVRLFLDCARDGSVPLNDLEVPRGRSFELLAQMANRADFRTRKGELWKRTRAQQVIFNGLARQMTFTQRRELYAQGRDYEAAVKDCERKIWDLFRVRVRHGRRWQHEPKENKHYLARILPDGSQVLFEHRPKPRGYWAKLRFKAKSNGTYRPPDAYWWLDQK